MYTYFLHIHFFNSTSHIIHFCQTRIFLLFCPEVEMNYMRNFRIHCGLKQTSKLQAISILKVYKCYTYFALALFSVSIWSARSPMTALCFCLREARDASCCNDPLSNSSFNFASSASRFRFSSI